MKLSALFSLLTGCSKLPPPAISELLFPVIVLPPNGSPLISKDAAELQVMHVNYVNVTDPTPPVLIDSSLAAYTMEKLHSTKGGLWLMMNPNGVTPVVFDLKRAGSGADVAREHMRKYRARWDDAETAAWRKKKLDAAGTFQEMLEAVKGSGAN